MPAKSLYLELRYPSQFYLSGVPQVFLQSFPSAVIDISKNTIKNMNIMKESNIMSNTRYTIIINLYY